MPKVSEIRAQFPMYGDLSDDQLLIGLHKKFYSDMPMQTFLSSIERDTERARLAPKNEMGPLGKFAVGAGAATDRAMRGLGGLVGADDTQGAEDAALYRKNHPGGWATAGEVGADIAMTALPSMKIAQGAAGLGTAARVAANVAGNAGLSAAMAPEDRGLAAIGGGAGAGLGMALGKVLPLATASGRAALLERRAGRVLAKDIAGEGAGAGERRTAAEAAAKEMEDYLATRGGVTKDVPLTTAQTLRQAEGDNPLARSLALARRQLSVAGHEPAGFGQLVRDQNEGLHGALGLAAQDAGGLESSITARKMATDPMRDTALHYAGQVEDIAAPLRDHVNGMLDSVLPGSPAGKLAEQVKAFIAKDPSPANLYELKKILTDKLYAPNAPGVDEFTAIVKNQQREVVKITKLIDDVLNEASATGDVVNQMHIAPGTRTVSGGGPTTHAAGEGTPPQWGVPESNANQRNLFGEGQVDSAPNANVQLEPGVPPRRMTAGPERLNEPPPGMAQPGLLPEETSPGRWKPYLEKYAEMSKPVNSARAQQAILENVNAPGGPMIGELPELTRNTLKRAMLKGKAEDARFGSDNLTPDARGRFDELTNFMQRNEEVMRTAKLGGTGGGGSQTAMQGGAMGEVGPSGIGMLMNMLGVGHAGAAIGAARGVSHILSGNLKGEVARMMLNPEAAIKGIRAALNAGRELSPAQQAFRTTISGLGISAGQPNK